MGRPRLCRSRWESRVWEVTSPPTQAHNRNRGQKRCKPFLRKVSFNKSMYFNVVNMIAQCCIKVAKVKTPGISCINTMSDSTCAFNSTGIILGLMTVTAVTPPGPRPPRSGWSCAPRTTGRRGAGCRATCRTDPRLPNVKFRSILDTDQDPAAVQVSTRLATESSHGHGRHWSAALTSASAGLSPAGPCTPCPGQGLVTGPCAVAVGQSCSRLGFRHHPEAP